MTTAGVKLTDATGAGPAAVQAAAALATFAWTVAKDRKGAFETDVKTVTPVSTMPTGVKRHSLGTRKRYEVTIDPVLTYSTNGKIRPKKGGGKDFLKALAAYSEAVGKPPPGGTTVDQIPHGSGLVLLHKGKVRTIDEGIVEQGTVFPHGESDVLVDVKGGTGLSKAVFTDRYDFAQLGWSFHLKWSLPCTITFDRVMGTDNKPHIDGLQIVHTGQVMQPKHSTLKAVWSLSTKVKEGPSGNTEIPGVSVRLTTTVIYATQSVPPVSRGFIVWADGDIEVDGVLLKVCPGLSGLEGTNPVPAEMQPGSDEYLDASKPAKRTAEAGRTSQGGSAKWEPNPQRVKEALRVHVKQQYGVHLSDARGQARLETVFNDISPMKILLFLADVTKLRGTSRTVAVKLGTAFRNLDDAARAVELVKARLDEQFKSYTRAVAKVGKPNAEEGKAIAIDYLLQLHSLADELRGIPSDLAGHSRAQRRMASTAEAGVVEAASVLLGRSGGDVRKYIEANLPSGTMRGWFRPTADGGRDALVDERVFYLADFLYFLSGSKDVAKPPRYGVGNHDWVGLDPRFDADVIITSDDED